MSPKLFPASEMTESTLRVLPDAAYQFSPFAPRIRPLPAAVGAIVRFCPVATMPDEPMVSVFVSAATPRVTAAGALASMLMPPQLRLPPKLSEVGATLPVVHVATSVLVGTPPVQPAASEKLAPAV